LFQNSKKALKSNSSSLLNSDKCNKTINDNIQIQKQIITRKKTVISNINNNANSKKEEKNNIEIVEAVESNSDVKVTEEVKAKENLFFSSQKSIIPQVLSRKKTLLEKPVKERRFLIFRFQKVIRSALTELYENNITINEYFNNNPFPKSHFSTSKSREFFDEVKLGNDKRVLELLALDRFLVYEYDHFKQTGYHWAAKRGLKSTLEILVSHGIHLNFFHLNKRTPLYLAAKNNHFEVCKYLLERGANPFLKSSNDKKPIDVCTDENIKRVLKVNMDNINIINKWFEVIDYHRQSKRTTQKKLI